jgi:uncharacterized metal-binding protein YceD (DUF177 family)
MTEIRSEFHRPIPTHDLPMGGRSFDIEARPDERAALARRFEILAIHRLRAGGVIRPQASGRIKLEGHLFAEVVQTCVITLEPVTATIDVPLERLYGFDVMKRIESGFNEDFLDLADDLPAETLIDDVVDIGAAAAEQLGLELDLYPRKPGAVFEELPDEWPKEYGGPLAQLADWRKRMNETG